jgi:hypothetical protein
MTGFVRRRVPFTKRSAKQLSAGVDTERARVVDVYAFYESARALFSDAIVRLISRWRSGVQSPAPPAPFGSTSPAVSLGTSSL